MGERLSAFLSSKHFQEMPINKTSTRLFALIAHDAATHQKLHLTRGPRTT
jgi:hypothetical protein